MQIINGIACTANVLDWLSNSRTPRILHVFDRACNLIDEHREVLSIVTTEIGNGPFNLVIDASTEFSFEAIHLQSEVAISPALLTIGHITIDTHAAATWDPRPDWDALHAQRNHVVAQLEKLALASYASQGGPLWTQSPVFSPLVSALTTADLSSCVTAARQLAGLGPGLTPAGDDFVTAALYAAWIIHPPDVAGCLAQEVASSTAPLTTSLSAAWLRSAGKGEAGDLWHRFFDALLTGDEAQILTSADKILNVGATSGADALAGFTNTMLAFAESRRSHVIP